MKIILSPAKRLNLSKSWEAPFSTQCQFLERADEISSVLKGLSIRQLGLLMRTSPSVSRLNQSRVNAWTKEVTEERGKPAVLAFDGGVYRFLKASMFSMEDLAYAQDHIRIISGLYGLLRPLDLILPYRLEMGTMLRIRGVKNLHSYWKDILTEGIQEWLDDGEPLINLASQEYARAIDFSTLRNPVITPSFKNKSPNGDRLRIVGFWTKEARGAMTREVIFQRMKEAEILKQLSPRDYRFSEELSTDSDWIFVK